jgi:hypothetical protein
MVETASFKTGRVQFHEKSTFNVEWDETTHGYKIVFSRMLFCPMDLSG